MAAVRTNYVEIQRDEIEVLKSIFAEDFVEEDVKVGAWKKASDRAFRVVLRGSTVGSENAVVLFVTLPATYPKTAPKLRLQHGESLRHKFRAEAEKIIQDLPQALLGNEMIYDIAAALQDLVEKQDQKGLENVQTLDEERIAQDEAARQALERTAFERQAEAIRLAEEEAARDEQTLRLQMTQQRDARADRKVARESEVAVQAEALQEVPGGQSFERPSTKIKSPSGNAFVLSAVYNRVFYRRIDLAKIYLVQPEHKAPEHDTNVFLCLKQYDLPKGVSELKQEMQELESKLDQLMHMPEHPYVTKPLNFRIHRANKESSEKSTPSVVLLFYFSPNGSLQDLLSIAGMVDPKTAKAWFMQLLEGLHHCHQQGIAHGSIHLGNIQLWESDVLTTIVKWSDAGYINNIRQLGNVNARKFVNWEAPEARSPGKSSMSTLPIDIWNLGTCLAQVAFGEDIQKMYETPINLLSTCKMSRSFRAVLQAVFNPEIRKRASAWDLLHFEFFRNNDPFEDVEGSRMILSKNRTRRESEAPMDASEYSRKFVEEGKLGRGGFGEVFRARNRTDGQLYAIKKIKAVSRAALDPVLSETTVLSRLNNPHVVRYFSSWIEEDAPAHEILSDTMTSMDTRDISSSSPSLDPHFPQSSRGLDFISSNNIVFGAIEDSDSETSDMSTDNGESSEEDGNTGSSHPVDHHSSSSRSKQQASDRAALLNQGVSGRGQATVLYIQMEYCKQETLRNAINAGLQNNLTEIWRMFRQIVQGLAHIHAASIVHRDLKPENVFIDDGGDVRIGDFGLARPGEMKMVGARKGNAQEVGSFTKDVGTAFYVAPEVRSGSTSRYDEKADMYSLGIIFLEMTVSFATYMERAETLGPLAHKEHVLPAQLTGPEKIVQSQILHSLLQYEPSKRPSCIELLDLVPIQGEDQASQILRKALRGHDPRFRSDITQTLFLEPAHASNMMEGSSGMNLAKRVSLLHGVSAMSKESSDLELQAQVKSQLTNIFRCHGAVERTDNPATFPWHPYYSVSDVVRFLDTSGEVYQLPYDLILPNAILLAGSMRQYSRSFTFADVYRPDPRKDEPRIFGEADFDIAGSQRGNVALEEAETIKVVDEIIERFPNLSSTSMCYHMNHSRLLDMILAFCAIDEAKWFSVKEIMSKLNTADWTWAKVRHELRSPPVSLPSTSLDELEGFDWRDTVEKAIPRLRLLLQQTDMNLEEIFARLTQITSYLTRMNLQHKVYLCPLSSYNEKFYRGNIYFQCLHDRKKRAVFAAGGRYDRLIKDHQAIPSKSTNIRCVGFQLTWSGLCAGMSSFLEAQTKMKSKRRNPVKKADWITRRCDILVDCFDSSLLESVGIEIVSGLWASQMSAELANSSNANPSNTFTRASSNQDNHTWTIFVKSADTVKVRNATRQDEVEVRVPEIINHMRGEIRERDRNETRGVPRKLARLESHQDRSTNAPDVEVKVLMAESKGKKTNRKTIVGEAVSRAQEWCHSTLEDAIIAIETKDDIFKALQNTDLRDPESWRRVVQAAPPGDRQYLGQIQDMLKEQRDANAVFLYNFRSKAILHYPL